MPDEENPYVKLDDEQLSQEEKKKEFMETMHGKIYWILYMLVAMWHCTRLVDFLMPIPDRGMGLLYCFGIAFYGMGWIIFDPLLLIVYAYFAAHKAQYCAYSICI